MVELTVELPLVFALFVGVEQDESWRAGLISVAANRKVLDLVPTSVLAILLGVQRIALDGAEAVV